MNNNVSLIADHNSVPILTFQTMAISHEGHGMLAHTPTKGSFRCTGVEIFDSRVIKGLLDCRRQRHASLNDAWYAVYKDVVKTHKLD
jgi:hypothetical protein